MFPRPPGSPLLPYTTLFRSREGAPDDGPFRDDLQGGDPAGDEDYGQTYSGPMREYRGMLGRYRAVPRANAEDRKSTRLNSSHLVISYAVLCLKQKRLSVFR